LASEAHSNSTDRILLTGVENSLTELTPEELSSLRRVLNMSLRFAATELDRSEGLNVLRENVGRAQHNDRVEKLASLVVEYLDRSIRRIESGLRTWLGVQVSLRLRELESENDSGKERAA
jgi:hypothetical protein